MTKWVLLFVDFYRSSPIWPLWVVTVLWLVLTVYFVGLLAPAFKVARKETDTASEKAPHVTNSPQNFGTQSPVINVTGGQPTFSINYAPAEEAGSKNVDLQSASKVSEVPSVLAKLFVAKGTDKTNPEIAVLLLNNSKDFLSNVAFVLAGKTLSHPEQLITEGTILAPGAEQRIQVVNAWTFQREKDKNFTLRVRYQVKGDKSEQWFYSEHRFVLRQKDLDEELLVPTNSSYGKTDRAEELESAKQRMVQAFSEPAKTVSFTFPHYDSKGKALVSEFSAHGKRVFFSAERLIFSFRCERENGEVWELVTPLGKAEPWENGIHICMISWSPDSIEIVADALTQRRDASGVTHGRVPGY